MSDPRPSRADVPRLRRGAGPARPGRLAWTCAALVAALAGCASTAAPTPAKSRTVAPTPRVAAPAPSGASAESPEPSPTADDYQLGGAYPPPAGVSVVARDSTDSPAPGTYGICYINAFQTQSGESERWLSQGVVLLDGGGSPVADPGWPDEMLLDPSTAEQRATIVRELTTELTRCATAGFDAVELDNLDSWTRSDGLLTSENTVLLATGLVQVAHDLGLAAAQKNTPELGMAGRDVVGFDLAVAEECIRWDECSAYTAVYGERVIDIEYTDDLSGTLPEVCATAGRPSLLVVRDRDLVAAGEAGYSYEACGR